MGNRFAVVSSVTRTAHRKQLEALIAKLFSCETSELWNRRLEEAGLAYGAVRNIADALGHPQVEARRLVVQAESEVGPLPLIRFPFAPELQPRRVPSLGEHTEELLAEVGYSASEVARLCGEGVVHNGAQVPAKSAM